MKTHDHQLWPWALLTLALSCTGSPLFSQGEEVVEIFTQHFYDDLSITGSRLANSNLVAHVTLAQETPAGEENCTVATNAVRSAAV